MDGLTQSDEWDGKADPLLSKRVSSACLQTQTEPRSVWVLLLLVPGLELHGGLLTILRPLDSDRISPLGLQLSGSPWRSPDLPAHYHMNWFLRIPLSLCASCGFFLGKPCPIHFMGTEHCATLGVSTELFFPTSPPPSHTHTGESGGGGGRERN